MRKKDVVQQRKRSNPHFNYEDQSRRVQQQPAGKRIINHSKAMTQGKTLSIVMEKLLIAVFAEQRPADRVLSAMFRANRQLGSRDRRFISETVFAFFRYLGITSLLLSQEEWAILNSSGKLPDDSRKFAAMIAGTWFLEKVLPRPEGLIFFLNILHIPSCEQQFDGDEAILHFVANAAGISQLRKSYSKECICPDWIFKELPFSEPSQLQSFLECLRNRPPMWIRVQTETSEEMLREFHELGIVPQAHSRLDNAFALYRPAVNLFTLESFRTGAFEVQDLASQCIGVVAAPQPGERWWDACAGAGGKSLQLASLMKRKGTVVASDIRGYKLEELKKRARRAGFSNIVIKIWDGKRLKEKQRGKFDGVLVDAPCSCTGTWRRNPDARWNVQKKEIAEFAELQLSILEKAAEAVKAGGTLVYATCSLIATENSGVVEKFLDKHPDFSPEFFLHPLTGKPVEGMLQIYPWDADCDGMFVAKFRLNAKKIPVPTE